MSSFETTPEVYGNDPKTLKSSNDGGISNVAASWKRPIPKRLYSTLAKNDDPRNLPLLVSIVGLGCSSFSNFFDDNNIDNTAIDASHPTVQEWIATIHYAITQAGITLLDTAPWYGHGLSERVVGWALSSHSDSIDRNSIVLQTKVGRYEADPALQFDFSHEKTVRSVQDSLQRLQTTYIDVLQLHDPEFAPTLNVLMEETIPAMLECKEAGYCRALGMTGYPLAVQHQILVESFAVLGRNVWDQAMTYGHFNLYTGPILLAQSPLAAFCRTHDMPLIGAAPLSMGLLTPGAGPPAWHPASSALQAACQQAAAACDDDDNVDIATLALLYALHFRPSPLVTTVVGLRSVQQVQTLQRLANRSQKTQDEWEPSLILTSKELAAYRRVMAIFDSLEQSEKTWDGVGEAHRFWEALGTVKFEKWQEH